MEPAPIVATRRADDPRGRARSGGPLPQPGGRREGCRMAVGSAVQLRAGARGDGACRGGRRAVASGAARRLSASASGWFECAPGVRRRRLAGQTGSRGCASRHRVRWGRAARQVRHPGRSTAVEPFTDAHLRTVLQIRQAEGWTTLPADPARAQRVLTAPGAICVVAVARDVVVGFTHVLSDGEVQAYLALLAVRADYRNRGIGRLLVQEGLRQAGGMRLDLLTDEAEAFYKRLPSKQMPGFRVYPTET